MPHSFPVYIFPHYTAYFDKFQGGDAIFLDFHKEQDKKT